MLKRLKVYDYLVIIELLWIMLSVVGTARFSTDFVSSDAMFLFNRVSQLRNSLLDGNILGVFFYNDFSGVGYGSAFFYGYLTLLPFVFITDYAIFCKIFFMVSFLVLYLGTRSFCKRFTENYQFITFLFMSSPFVVLIYEGLFMYLNYYAVGISLFFLAKCIDFFRDKKSFIPASILFFLVLNTHMITSVISFIICILLFIKYFDKSRIKSYCYFCTYTIIICLYYVVNFFWHSESVLNVTSGTKYFINDYKILLEKDYVVESYGYCITGGIGGFLNIFLEKPSGGLIILTPFVFILGLYLFIKRKPSIKELVIMISFGVSCIISIHFIWMYLFEKFNIPIQFPLRYTFYTILLFLILCFKDNFNRVLKTGIVIISCIYMLLIPLFFSQDVEIPIGGDYRVSNGEYLSEDFIWDTDTFNNLRSNCESSSHSFSYEKESRYTHIYIDIPTDEWITVPKLWYKGYIAVDESGKRYPCEMGYSQFVRINPQGYAGKITVYYAHTWWLYTLEVFCYIMIGVGSTYGITKYIRQYRKKENTKE